MDAINKLLELADAAHTSEWWRNRTDAQKRHYLKRHPNSKFKPGNSAKKAVAPAASKPKLAPVIKAKPATHVRTAGDPKAKRKQAAQVHKNWQADKDVQAVDQQLKTPQSWGKRKIKKAATVIRDALKDPNAKSFMKASAKVLGIAGAGVLLTGAGLALGVDTGVFLPALMSRAWDGMKNQRSDLALVSEVTRRMRERLKDATPDDLAESLHTKKK